MIEATWPDSLQLMLSLFERWQPNQALIDMFEAELGHRPQRQVQHAIRLHKRQSGRFLQPVLDEIVALLPRSDKAGPAVEFEAWLREQPAARRDLITTYWRVASSGTRSQFDMVRRWLNRIGGDEVLQRDPLNLRGQMIHDRDLPALLAAWCEFIAQVTDPATPRMGAARVARTEAQVARSVTSDTRAVVNTAKRLEHIQRQAAAVGGAS